MYCLNTSVQSSDVILVRGAAKASKVITFFSKGHYSHACLVIDKRRVIEAIFSGVQITSVARFVIDNNKNIKVLRPNFETDEQKLFVQRCIKDFAFGHQGKGYNVIDAAKSIFGLSFKVDKGNLFCSQLVAVLFKQAGFPLFTKHEHNVNPNDYVRSSKLTDVTSETISKIPQYIERRANINGLEIRAIDNDSDASTSSFPAKLLREFVEESGFIFQQYNLPRPRRPYDIIDQLTDPKNCDISIELDKKVSDLYKSKGVNDSISEKDKPSDLDFYKTEFREYGRKFADEEYASCLYLIPTYRKGVEEINVYRDIFFKVHEKFGFEYALQQIAYYEIVASAALFVLQEMDKQIKAYNCLYGNENAH